MADLHGLYIQDYTFPGKIMRKSKTFREKARRYVEATPRGNLDLNVQFFSEHYQQIQKHFPEMYSPWSTNSLFSDFVRKSAGVILDVFPTIWGRLTRLIRLTRLTRLNRLTRLTRLFKIVLNRLCNDQGVILAIYGQLSIK